MTLLVMTLLVGIGAIHCNTQRTETPREALDIIERLRLHHRAVDERVDERLELGVLYAARHLVGIWRGVLRDLLQANDELFLQEKHTHKNARRLNKFQSVRMMENTKGKRRHRKKTIEKKNASPFWSSTRIPQKMTS